ncbi:MAG: DUF3194 domain-containing protein [Candidatus Bathyarchaeota archaeon]|nr:DUF3194 domain-containing protein [Candidatus Bathyarchaeota archaeon]
MEEIGIPELTEDQMQTLSEMAEEAARDYILSNVSRRQISILNIVIEAVGSKPVTITIDVDLLLSPPMKGVKTEDVAQQAAGKALEAVERCLRDLSCQSKS